MVCRTESPYLRQPADLNEVRDFRLIARPVRLANTLRTSFPYARTAAGHPTSKFRTATKVPRSAQFYD